MGIFEEGAAGQEPVVVEPKKAKTIEVKEAQVVKKVVGLVCIEDIKTGGTDITLTNGTNLLVPKNGRSKPTLRKFVPPYVNKLVGDGELKIINC